MKESTEVFLLPEFRTAEPIESAFFFAEVGVVDDSPALRIINVWHDRMKHFVVKYIFDKPLGHKYPVEEWMNADDSIIFLD